MPSAVAILPGRALTLTALPIAAARLPPSGLEGAVADVEELPHLQCAHG
jgi:hypothetical protein